MRLFLLAPGGFLLLWIPACQKADGLPATKAAAPPKAIAQSLALFEQRIRPLLSAPKPSSCAECHLSGVDLKAYIRPTAAETFAALEAAELIDRQSPDESKLLALIARKPERPSLVSEEARKEEYEAFRAWLREASGDPAFLATASDLEGEAPTAVPVEVIRYARTDRVLRSFIEDVWSEVGRCAACHSPDRNQDQVKEHGEEVSWIKLRDPQGTLSYLEEAGLIDLESPEESLLLLKPTNQVEHGGGQKLLFGDRTYRQFREFIEDYAKTRKGAHKVAADLPRPSPDVSQVSDIWLKVTDVPAELDEIALQVDLYPEDPKAASGFANERVATGQRAVFGAGKLWQQHLTLVAPRDSRAAAAVFREQSLPPGRYLARVYVDRADKLRKNYPHELGPPEEIGTVDVESAWPAGYGEMTVIAFPERTGSRADSGNP